MKSAQQFLFLFLVSINAFAQGDCSSCKSLDEILKSETAFSDSLYSVYDYSSFEKLKTANQIVDLYHPDNHLLNAAIFYATNKIRVKKNLPQFSFSPELRNAAWLQAIAMEENDFFSHVNLSEPEIRSLEDRVAYFGYDWSSLTENIATEFLLRYVDNDRYTWDEKNGTYRFYDEDQHEITARTYLEVAEAIVQSWMNSPPHKKQILNKDYTELGCGAAVISNTLNSLTIPQLYGVQTFGNR